MSEPLTIPLRSSLTGSNASSPSSSLSGSPEIHLASSTIAMLDSFLAEKAEEERLFRELEEQALQEGVNAAARDSSAEDGKRGLSVDEFRTAFAEDWQLSQFW
jgi:EEF1A lysine methyltransferase 1